MRRSDDFPSYSRATTAVGIRSMITCKLHPGKHRSFVLLRECHNLSSGDRSKLEMAVGPMGMSECPGSSSGAQGVRMRLVRLQLRSGIKPVIKLAETGFHAVLGIPGWNEVIISGRAVRSLMTSTSRQCPLIRD